MITKIPSRRRDSKPNFKALINYCLGITGHEKNAVIHVGMKNLNSPPEKAYLEMEGLSYENVRSKNPMLHFILSWRSNESPTNEQADEAVEIALKELNLEDCQALWTLQKDTENLHVHVVVNRISPETFKAVRPAKGWTKKALERAARKIEFVQGWEIEQSGRYTVDSSGNVYEKAELIERDSKLSQKARDIEAHTGAESIERVAKREILPLLESAKSWEELYKGLSEHRANLERRGKGAVLHFCGTTLKLSSVSRKCSLTQLEKRLGSFVAPDENVQVVSEQFSVGASVVPLDVKKSWEDYQFEKEKYLEAKNSVIKNLRAEQKSERDSLHELQKSRWQKIKSENWVGRGHELNEIRMLMSAFNKVEQLNLRDEHKKEMLELKSHYLRSFPSFKRWLLEQEREEDYKKYRFPGAFILSPAQSGITSVELPKGIDLRNYQPRRGSGDSVLYCRAGKLTAEFSDMGKRIILNKKTLSEESVLSALQLANAKWGATQITGSDEYKALCVKVAVKHGLKIANPDLAVEIERQKQSKNINYNYIITVEEIEKLNLVENPKIYVNPRKDNQSYKGQILHVDSERGYCVQLSGQHSLFVHSLDKFGNVPKVGEMLKISYTDEAHSVLVQCEEIRRNVRGL